jgi:hypothetical protein
MDYVDIIKWFHKHCADDTDARARRCDLGPWDAEPVSYADIIKWFHKHCADDVNVWVKRNLDSIDVWISEHCAGCSGARDA